MVVNVHTHLGVSANRMTMMTCMDQLVQATRAKIQDVRVDCPGRPIVMIGFNSGAALACQVSFRLYKKSIIEFGSILNFSYRINAKNCFVRSDANFRIIKL